MAKRLTHTGEQLDEAIGKVLAGYTDVSEVTATAPDVRVNKKFVSNQKVLTEGTMPDATVTASVTVAGGILSDTESAFPVQITPKATLSNAGYVAQGHTADTTVKYIKASEKSITANGTYDPPNNGFFSRIVVDIPSAQLNPATISLSDGVLSMTDGNNGTFGKYFDIYADAEESPKASVQINATDSASYDLSQLNFSTGSHTIYVRVRGIGMTDSESSGNVTYVATSQLPAPIISLDGDILTIGAVEHAVGYEIHADGSSNNLIQTTTGLTYDLAGWLGAYTGSFDITVYALAAIPYIKSQASNSVSFTVGNPVQTFNVSVASNCSINLHGQVTLTIDEGLETQRTVTWQGGWNGYTPSEAVIKNTSFDNVTSLKLTFVDEYEPQSENWHGFYYTMGGVNGVLNDDTLILTADLLITAMWQDTCLTGDALVIMADGTEKRIDEIEVGEYILSYDWETMHRIPNKVIYTDKDEGKSHTEYDIWEFSDGSLVKTVHRHRFYNAERKAFVYMDEWNIGEHTYKIDGTAPALVSHKAVRETVRHYKITGERGTNFFVNSLLTGDRYCPKNIILKGDRVPS